MESSGLPNPNVSHTPPDTDKLDDRTVKGMICNPIYTGVPPFQQLVSDEAWIQAATQLIAEEGPQQFLVNMLYMLRQSMEAHLNVKATDSNGQEMTVRPTAIPSLLYCYHDDFPLLEIHGAYVCSAEYIFEHLDNVPITDLVTSPELALVFQNGHTLPLIAPDTGRSLEVDDDDRLLDELNGLSLMDVEWDDDRLAFILHFGNALNIYDDSALTSADPAFLDEQEAFEPIESIAVHLNAIRHMTCPYLSGKTLDNNKD
jgi:hypothetical protein